MTASLWEPAPPVGLLHGAEKGPGEESSGEDFGFYGWEGREWGASRPEELLRRVQQKAPVREKLLPRFTPKVNLASSQNNISPEESRSGLETHQMNQGARNQQLLNNPKHGASSGLGKWMDKKYQGLQRYLRPILVNRRGQPKLLGSKVFRHGRIRPRPSPIKQNNKPTEKKKQSKLGAKKYVMCTRDTNIWANCASNKHSTQTKGGPQQKPPKGITKRYGRRQHKNWPLQSSIKGRSKRPFPPKKPRPSWPTRRPRPKSHKKQEKVKTEKSLLHDWWTKHELESARPRPTFSMSFDPTSDHHSSSQSLAIHTGEDLRSPKLRESGSSYNTIPRRHRSSTLQLQTKTHSAFPSQDSSPSQSTALSKSHFGERLHRTSPTKLQRLPTSLSRKKSPSLTSRAKLSHPDPPLESAPPPHRRQESSPEQSLKRPQWQLPARTPAQQG